MPTTTSTEVRDRLAGGARIEAAFAAARDRGRGAALMPFLMGGFPTVDLSREIGEAYAEAGADLVELGIPFADAVADGPVIRSAAITALRAGATLEGVLDVAYALSPRVPVVVMSYYGSIVLAGGAQRFAGALGNAGVSGLIVPDVPPNEVAAVLYTVSTPGKTGERPTLGDGVARVLRRAKAGTSLPVALGFGISAPEHARQAADVGADGVIVGSRLVRAAAEETDPAAAVGALVAGLAAALRDRRTPHRPT